MDDAAGKLTATWREFAQTRDPALRNALIEAHLGLARTVAAVLYRHRGGLEVEFADYMQFATLGLIEAVDRFDVDRGVAFGSFATLRIRGAVLNNLFGLSEQYQQIDLRKRLRQERAESLQKASGSSADLFGQLAEMAVGLALSHLLEGSGMLQSTDDAAGAYQQQFYDSAGERQLRESLGHDVETLPDQERRVVRYHYFQSIGFTEIAALLGVSKGRVSQIHRRALMLLRQARSGRTSVERDI